MDIPPADRQAFVDTGAITANVAALCRLIQGDQVPGDPAQGGPVQGDRVQGSQVQGSQVLAAVKADGYGHGMVAAARAALAGRPAGWGWPI